jgi:hypothetical protein
MGKSARNPREKEAILIPTTVVIPARNEGKTIGAIVEQFSRHSATAGKVYVAMDADTDDNTAEQTWLHGGCPIFTDVHGKGEVIYKALQIIPPEVRTGRLILCDGDYTGLTREHIDKMLYKHLLSIGVAYESAMVIGVPDWPEGDIPDHVTNAWPRVSGFRSMMWRMVPANAHGYLLETQLNNKAVQEKIPVHTVFLKGLKSPFQWPLTERRMQALAMDQRWGRENGIL